jgi:hypothetical protein
MSMSVAKFAGTTEDTEYHDRLIVLKEDPTAGHVSVAGTATLAVPLVNPPSSSAM